ncbi:MULTISPECIES: phosphoribosyl-ATP diphosphatase [Ruminococcus]|jgi:phosphoribosyl-ATP pyrophosphohydrolase|uniref:phosphoribosyl-ATP diphosphatase n=1 Tax=Ruminococcus TaxID=1263 RepID=UPI00033BF002|nr:MULTISPECIES: phosphoribosyl-ATP diphosphatase [Ruminococcus]CDD53592.1 phosphoribosyl-ATP pyrophosphatase [Ruminococcus sp. CAG:379]
MSNNVLEDLYQVVLDRKAQYASSGESADEIKKKSYTCYLFSQGENKILKKCGEECTEMVIAAKNHDNNELKNEISDLLYHIMVLCAEENLPFSEVEAVLEERSKKIGNLKVLKQVDHET